MNENKKAPKKNIGRQTAEQRAEEKRIAAEKAAAKRKKTMKMWGIIGGAAFVVVVFTVLAVLGIFPPKKGPLTGKHYVEIDVENYGLIAVELNADVAPITVENFLNLARSGFYDGLTFHRIMEGFMIQGGDPDGNGSGGSDSTIKGEFIRNGVYNTLSHTRGAISMARVGASTDEEDEAYYNTASSQFFIVQSDKHAETLDGRYAIFGYVTSGMEVVDAITAAANPIDGNGTIVAAEQPVMRSVRVVDK